MSNVDYHLATILRACEEMDRQLDLNCDTVQLEIREDGRVLWVHNADGLTVLRISGIEELTIVDHREVID